MLAQNVVPEDAKIGLVNGKDPEWGIWDVPLCIRSGIIDGNIDRGIHISTWFFEGEAVRLSNIENDMEERKSCGPIVRSCELTFKGQD